MEGSVLLAMINRSEVITARKHLQMPLPSLSHSPQILPGLGIAQRCRLLEPLPGDFDVAANAIAFIVDDAEVVHAGGVAERNALLEQLARQRVIARNASAVVIEQPEIVHACRHTGVGGGLV